MRDRLIDLIESARYWGANTSDEIADHLLADGVICPPCKVGDVVHAKGEWWLDKDEVVDYLITNIAITQNKAGEWKKKYRAMRFFGGKTYDSQLNFSFEDIGKTVFLTREEAEQALTKRR